MNIEPISAEIYHTPLSSVLFPAELENEIFELDKRIQALSLKILSFERELDDMTNKVKVIRLGPVMPTTEDFINTTLADMRKELSQLYERNEVRLFMLKLHQTDPEILDISLSNSLTEADRKQDLSPTELLFQKNPNAINTFVTGHHTILTRAISLNSEIMVRFLLEHGAQVDLANGFGTLPLAEAARLPNLAISTLLLQHDADIYQLTAEKVSVLTNAFSKKKAHFE